MTWLIGVSVLFLTRMRNRHINHINTLKWIFVGLLAGTSAYAQPLTLDDGGMVSGYFIEPLPYNGTLSSWNFNISGTPLGNFTCANTGTGSNACYAIFTSTVDQQPCQTPSGTPYNCVAFIQGATPININLNWPVLDPPLENRVSSGPVKISLITKDTNPGCLNDPAPNNYCSLVAPPYTYVVSTASGRSFNAIITATQSPAQIRYDFYGPVTDTCKTHPEYCRLPPTSVINNFCARNPGVCGCTVSLCISRLPIWLPLLNSGDPDWVFSGIVQSFDDGAGLTTFNVERVFAPTLLDGARLPSLQVSVGQGTHLKVGEEWIVFAHGGGISQTQPLQLAGLVDVTEASSVAKGLAVANALMFEDSLAERLNSASMVVAGPVEAVGPIKPTSGYVSLRSPTTWRTVSISVQSLLKGDDKEKVLVVNVPAAPQDNPTNTLNIGVGDKGIWLVNGTSRETYSVQKREDVLDTKQLPLVKQLLPIKQ